METVKEFFNNNYSIIGGIFLLVAIFLFIINFIKMTPEEQRKTLDNILNQLKKVIYSLIISVMKNQTVSFDFDKIKTWVYNQLPEILTDSFTEEEVNQIISDGYDMMLIKLGKNDSENEIRVSANKSLNITTNDVEMFDKIFDDSI